MLTTRQRGGPWGPWGPPPQKQPEWTKGLVALGKKRGFSHRLCCAYHLSRRGSLGISGPRAPPPHSCPTALPAHPQAQRRAPSLGTLKTRGPLRPLCSHLKQVTLLGTYFGGKTTLFKFQELFISFEV